MDQNGQETPLLVAEQVRKVYRTGGMEVEALAGLDLEVRRGELVAVMGPSGSGKTTLLNCLSGLDDIDGGRVLVEGQDLFAMSDARRTSHRARSMGFIFQAFNLIPVFSAAENVELPLLLNGVPARRARATAIGMLERVGLGHRTGGGGNYGQYSSKKVDQLFAQAVREVDEAKSAELGNQVDQQLTADMATIPLYAKPTYLAVRKTFTGVGDNATQEGPFWNSNLWAQKAT